jgi:ABC-type glutathione transport system ATPase component
MVSESTQGALTPELRVSRLNYRYKSRSPLDHATRPLAIADVSFEIEKGRTLSIIGHTGSGKSTILRCIIGLEEPDSGQILIGSIDRLRASGPERRALSRKVQVVLQDSVSALNPRLTISDVIVEPLLIHRIGDRRSRATRAKELLELVGLRSSMSYSHPHQLSGGQRQRVAIARALSIEPKLLLLDEPLSALDLSVKAQLSNLLLDLQDRFDLTYLHISHDLFGVANLSDEIAVLSGGRIVECGKRAQLLANPEHDETRSLLSAIA